MKRHQEFKNCLRATDNKVELGLKAFWLTIDAVFKDIEISDRDVKLLKEKMQKKNKNPSLNERVILGEKVKNALEKKREALAEKILQTLKPKCIDYRLNETVGDNMVLNSAFLVDRLQERQFDDLVDSLIEKHKEKLQFKYVGPIPPFNFVNLVIKWGSKD